jgi:hypothetical protein
MRFLLLFTPTQMMILVILTVLVALPCRIIFKRLGFSGWWSLVCFVPAVALIFLWYLAFSRWPEVETANDSKI